MENKKLLAVRIVNIVLIIGVLVLGIMRISNPIFSSTFDKVNIVVDFVALAFGFAYLITGYKKDSAIFYKGFMILFVLSSLFSCITDIIAQTIKGSSYITSIFLTFVFFGVIVLAFIQDLGSNVSFVIVGIIIAIDLFLLIYTLIAMGDINYIAFSASNFVTACTAATMIFAKYIDKAKRGTD